MRPFTQQQVDAIVKATFAAGSTTGCDHKQGQFNISHYSPPDAFALAMVTVGGWYLQSDLILAWKAVVEELGGKNKMFSFEDCDSIIKRVAYLNDDTNLKNNAWGFTGAVTPDFFVRWLVVRFLESKYDLVYALMAVIEHLTGSKVDYL